MNSHLFGLIFLVFMSVTTWGQTPTYTFTWLVQDTLGCHLQAYFVENGVPITYFEIFNTPNYTPELTVMDVNRTIIVVQTNDDRDDMTVMGQDTYFTALYAFSDAPLFNSMTARPEWKILPQISYELGQIGYTGVNVPCTLHFHALAALSYTIQPQMQDVTSFFCTSPQNLMNNCAPGWNTTFVSTTSIVFDPETSTPVTGEGQCLGMCGPSCCCWWWICGDCCMHPSCFFHDVVSCITGLATARCVSEGFEVFVRGNVFGYSCDPASWNQNSPIYA